MCFQGKTWRGVELVLGALARTLDRWKPLIKENKRSEMGCFIGWTSSESVTSSSAQFHQGSDAAAQEEIELRRPFTKPLPSSFSPSGSTIDAPATLCSYNKI